MGVDICFYFLIHIPFPCILVVLKESDPYFCDVVLVWHRDICFLLHLYRQSICLRRSWCNSHIIFRKSLRNLSLGSDSDFIVVFLLILLIDVLVYSSFVSDKWWNPSSSFGNLFYQILVSGNNLVLCNWFNYWVYCI